MAAPVTFGSSWARDWIWAISVTYNPGSFNHCAGLGTKYVHHLSQQCWIIGLLCHSRKSNYCIFKCNLFVEKTYSILVYIVCFKALLKLFITSLLLQNIFKMLNSQDGHIIPKLLNFIFLKELTCNSQTLLLNCPKS